APAPHETPVARAEPQPPTAGEAAPVVGASPAPVDVAPLPAVEQRHGIVPPRTATHLPLLAAAGVLMVGAGALLSRKRSRERRRRRRFVAI
ncbi:MAG TPA: LPXTG cell wall anchor domain-containing protein, partial [Gemmatimonadales bacterium]